MKQFINASLPTSSTALKRVNVLFDDKIIKISADEIKTEESPEVIDLKGKIILPGAIEPHCHLLADAESAGTTLNKVSKMALQGGITCLTELSYHSQKPLFSLKHLKQFSELVENHAFTDMAVWANVDMNDYPYHAEAAQELWAKGVVGIAIVSPSCNPAIADISFTEIMDLFMEIYESDTAFAFQGYDHDIHDGYSFEAQADGIKKILRRMQENPIHIPRVSSYPTIEFINTISKRSDISYAMNFSDIMHLYDPEAFPNPWHTDFPEHNEILHELIRTNKIYLLSNSCSATGEAFVPDLYQGNKPELMQYSYLWALSELWKARKIPLATVIKMTSENAAKRLGIYPQKGCLEAGSDADFVIYDPTENTNIVTPTGLNRELTGKIAAVYLRGEEVTNPTEQTGTFIRRTQSPKRRHNNTTWI